MPFTIRVLPRRSYRLLTPLLLVVAPVAMAAEPGPVRLPVPAPEVALLKFGQPAPVPPAEVLPQQTPRALGELRALPPVDVAGPQNQVNEQATWTLEQAEQLALRLHPALAQSRADIDALRGKYWQAGLKLNPVVGYVANEIGDDGAAGQQGASLSQTFQLGHKRAWRQAVVSREISVAEQQLQAVQLQVLTDVRLRFQQTLLAQYRLELLNRLVQVGRRTEETMSRLLEAQEARRIDLLQAKVQADKIDMQQQQAQAQLNNAWRMLRTALGDSSLAPRELQGSLRELSPEYTWEVVRSRLSDTSPQLARAALQIERARTEICRQRAEGVPNLTTGVQVAQDTATDTTLTSVSVKIPLPIYNRNQGNVSKAQSEFVAAQQAYRRLELALEQRLSEVYQEYRAARVEVDRYEESILPVATETLDLIRQAAEAGEATYLEVFTIQRTNFESHLEYLAALQRLTSAALRVEGLLLEGALEASLVR